MSSEQSLGQQKVSNVIRLVRPSVVVLCGPAACGKSTFAARQFRPTAIISSDHARALVCDDEQDQRFQAQAFALVHFLIEQRLSINRLCVVDSTALTEQARRNLLDLARKYQVPAFAIVLDVPLEKCIERDQSRPRSVGKAVIERQYGLFEQARANLKREGFEQVIELKGDELQNVEIEIVFRPVTRKPPVGASPELRRGAPRPSVGSPPPRPAAGPEAPKTTVVTPPDRSPVRVIQVEAPPVEPREPSNQDKPSNLSSKPS